MMHDHTSNTATDLDVWNVTPEQQRNSILGQNLLLAQQVSKRAHLTSLPEAMTSQELPPEPLAVSTRPSEDGTMRLNTSRNGDTERRRNDLPTANIGRPRPKDRALGRSSSTASAGEWTWCPPTLQRPVIPARTSSISTRGSKKSTIGKSDLAAFHRRSCQLFASLDSRVSNMTSTVSERSQTSPSTSPSLSSSVTTQATSILDDDWYNEPNLASLNLELYDPGMLTQLHGPALNFGDLHLSNLVLLGERRSSSQLSPHIISTEQVFWSSDSSREAEYAKIDAAHRGFKGIVKRMLPRSWIWSHGKRRDFHNTGTPKSSCVHPAKQHITQRNDKDGDQESVRRFRISIASATQKAIRGVQIHGVSRSATPLPLEPEDYEDAPRTNNGKEQKRAATTTANTISKVLAKVRSADALGKLFSTNGKSQTSKKLARRSCRYSGDLSDLQS